MGKIQTVPLNEICETIQYGYTASAAKEPVGPKFVRITDIVPDAIDWAEVPYCQIEESKKEKYVLKSGDIVIARTGATTGYAKYLKNPPPSIFASYLIRVRVKEGVDPRYIGFVVQSDTYKRFIKTHMGGAAQPNANAKVLTSFPVPLPSFQSQKKIATILSAYDDLIENNLRRIKILEEIAQSLYREWFVKFRFPACAKASPGRPGHQKVKMVDSPLGKIPEGWEVKRLGDIAEDMRRGVNPAQVSPDTPYIGLEHLPRKSIALSQWGFAGDVQSTKFEFKRGEILFGKIRPYFHKVGFAPIDGICSSDTIVIAAKDLKWYPLLLCCVSSEDFVAHATQTSKGTKMPRADWEILTKYPVSVPPLSLLTKFNSFLENNLGLIENFIFKNHNLRQTRDLLLSKLISGELDVSELDIAAPKEVST